MYHVNIVKCFKACGTNAYTYTIVTYERKQESRKKRISK